MENGFCTARPVNISYWQLKDRDRDLSAKIREGFGPDGLGIVTVSDVPGFSFLCQTLLHLSPRLANLPEDVKSMLEDPDARYNNGWSFGKDKLDNGLPDTIKASFFANPIIDVPTTDASLIKRYPSYCRPNRWPTSALPELEEAFKALGRLMLDVGLLLAYHCTQCGSKLLLGEEAPYNRWGDEPKGQPTMSKDVAMNRHEGLDDVLRRSRCHKGRLLYYYPRQQSKYTDDASYKLSWCGMHTDWGSLTGLTSGMFMKNAETVACPDSAAGLYVKTRNNQFVRVVFGEDEIAYQIGETTELLSRGHLCATPHAVRAPIGESALGVGRSTFVLFMQPDWDEVLQFPEKIPHHQELVSPNESLTFGEYTERRIGLSCK